MKQNKIWATCSEDLDYADTTPVSLSDVDMMVLSTIYFAAKTKLPFNRINSLFELHIKNGLDVECINLSWELSQTNRSQMPLSSIRTGK